ncbi:hypothetical protein [Agathobaculum sp. Marseille-P7918]|uniref:hypothetical protein n=1 Tax=Agathobaculum sp. Marseille-P7918 TaxID=2479843 RepID=UPI0035699B6E
MSKSNGILAMDPSKYREIDGVVFDLDSYAKHCAPMEQNPPATEESAPAVSIAAPVGILAMDPEHYRALDGVAMDEDSFERHNQPPADESRADEAVIEQAAPSGVFAVDPFPNGWYPAEDGKPPVPIMGGALPPVEILENGTHVVTVIRTVFLHTGSGSGSGSYVTSYTTSYRTSYLSSGSGSYVFGSCTYLVGGYGLELI